MRLLVLALCLPLLSSCALLQTPGRTLKAVGRTFGLVQTDAVSPQPGSTTQVALRASE